jgi:hypothetical protein
MRTPATLVVGVLLTLAPGLVAPTAGAIHHVNATLTGGANNGTSWTDAFRGSLALQSALALAQAGDEIWVVAGTYLPGPPGDIQSTFHMRDAVGIYGGFIGGEVTREQRQPMNVTTLSGDLGQDDVYGSPVWYTGWNINTPNALHVVTGSGVSASAVLDGFTIVAGYATSASGGGMVNVAGSPTISNCVFRRNLAGFSSGGGMYNQDASPSLTNCAFEQNWVHLGQGAGMYNIGACTISVTGCRFIDNHCTGDIPEAAGAAISNYPGASLVVERCVFQQNRAQAFYAGGGHAGTYGGAIHHMGAGLIVRNAKFSGNFANAGGAIWTWRDATIVNCLFQGNQAPEYQAQQGGWGGTAGAIGASAFSPVTVTVINCTIAGNTSKACGGVRFMSSAAGQVHNCILWANTDEHGSIGPSQIRGDGATFCDIQNMLVGIPGEDPPDPANFPDCIDINPLFIDLTAADLHLTVSSPCIDRASNALVPTGASVDLDGQPRIVDGDGNSSVIVDMGAYEFQPVICPADINGNGTVDTDDLIATILAWGLCANCPPAHCVTDIAPVPGGNCATDVDDLIEVILHWGTCP